MKKRSRNIVSLGSEGNVMETRRVQMKFIIIACLVVLQLPASGWAQGKKPPSLGELAAYMGADREQ